MRRRLAGEGLVRRRTDGRWEGRYRAVDGRKRSVYARTQREVIDKLRSALTLRDQGARPLDQRKTVGTFLHEWLENDVRPTRRPRTYESYEGVVRLYLAPALGRIALAKLQPQHIQAVLARVEGRRGQLSSSSIRYVYTVLRIALGRAVKMGLASRNVATMIDPPARRRAERRPLTASQLRVLLDGVRGDRLAALYLTAAGTGLRQGELLGLRWCDVDLERGTLVVRHTLQRGGRVLAEPKTERARRTLRLPGEVADGLREHRRRQLTERLAAGARWQDLDLVFATRTGTPLHSRNVTAYLQRHLRRLGLPHQRFHDLRHAFATLLIEAGEELGTVSRVLGHADYATTADVYAHLTPAILERAAARLDEVLSGQKVVTMVVSADAPTSAPAHGGP